MFPVRQLWCYLKLRDCKARVRKTEPEGKERLDRLRVVPAVAHFQAFRIRGGGNAIDQHAGILLRRMRGNIADCHGESDGQFAGRVGNAEQQIRDHVAVFLSGIPHGEHRCHRRDPRHQHGIAILDHDHGSRIGARHRGNQRVLIDHAVVRERERRAVGALGLDVAGHHDRDVG